MKTLCSLICVLILTTLAPDSVQADCSPASGVMINEIRFYDSDSPFGDERARAFVELYNKSGSPVDLTDWEITNVDGLLGSVFTLPAVSLPAENHLTVWFATGTDDTDFSDLVGSIYTNGDSIGVFTYEEDGIALYDDLGNIVDYVTWSENGAAPLGTALTDAESAGVWASGDYIPSVDGLTLVSWRLLPDGYDFHRARDWHAYAWGDSWFGNLMIGRNHLEITPMQGTGIEADSTVTFRWGRPNLNTDTYRIQVATDSTFAGGSVLDYTTTSTDTTLSLPDDVYFWRASLVDSCGEVGGGAMEFDVFPTSGAAPGMGGLATLTYAPTPLYWQRKDSQLLCIYDNSTAANRRPGCTEAASHHGPWDGSHPNNHANFQIAAGAFHVLTINCSHCRNYCARASIQMINHRFGGNLTQDRISFEYMKTTGTTDPKPEGDLGHDLPVPGGTVNGVLAWSLGNVTVHDDIWNAQHATAWGWFKTMIDQGLPVFVAQPGHAMVVDAYIDASTWSPGRPRRNMVRIRNPWPGNGSGWRYFDDPAVNLTMYWRMTKTNAAQPVTGTMQETTVTTDTDGDGIMDFDEGAPDYPASRPRLFDSRHDRVDTDLDEVSDKKEIRAYTFYSCGNNDNIFFPDVDLDGKRAEGDCDSDHSLSTGGFDGGEDIHDTGECGDRSDPFDFSDDVIFAVTDKFLYEIGEDVLMAGRYVHADTSYPVDIIVGCPTLVDKQPLGHDASLNSVNDGTIPFQKITTCPDPGLYLGVIDILRNNLCERGPCHNPDACWICLIPTFNGDDDDSTDWEDPTGTNNNPSGAFWQPVPDNWFNFAGLSWGIDSFWQPTQPVDAILRTKPIPVLTQGDLVFLQFQHAYFGMGGLQGTVRMSPDNGNNWITLFQFTPGNDVQGYEVVELTPFLSPPPSAPGIIETAVADPILIEFWATSPPGGGAWFVDDVFVGEMPAAQVGIPDDDQLPTTAFLAPNFPNPFQTETSIRFSLPANPGHVTLDILDVNGRRINRLVDAEMPGGSYVETWDSRDNQGRKVAAGIYFYRLESEHGVFTNKMTLIK